ncbi:PH domain-containing protein [Streptomyces griseocarneus]|uniref:PH domain-containing protein n=1 Tax=Streptomyces griseocarneus TaxID=51201 RepID=UPI00198B200C|nr:PH domain-containing protein [Streptomyces griseocarneus]MBZ6474387.1 PH domain-containing protein [Streptomyces griseocarneus]GHG68533.1 membrane protein [Streptomyces griseocarneus]
MSTPVPASALPPLPVTFRPTRTRIVLLSIGTALLVTLTVMSLLLQTLTTGDRITFICTGLLGLGVLSLLSRPKVVAAEDGVTVTNLTTTRRLDWAQIVRVNLRSGDAWVHLDLSDGTSLPAMGIQPGIARDRAIADARTLRALVEAHGTGHSAT